MRTKKTFVFFHYFEISVLKVSNLLLIIVFIFGEHWLFVILVFVGNISILQKSEYSCSILSVWMEYANT